MRPILERLNEATARIGQVILIAGAIASGDAFSDDFNDFLDDIVADDIEKLLGEIPDYVDLDARSYERCDAVFEWLTHANKLGFLMKVETPVMEPSGHNSFSFSWGHYSSQWVYAETFDEAIEKCHAWVSQRRASEKAKAKSKKKKGGA